VPGALRDIGLWRGRSTKKVLKTAWLGAEQDQNIHFRAKVTLRNIKFRAKIESSVPDSVCLIRPV